MCNFYSGPELTNCIFLRNTGHVHNTGDGGGGMHNWNSSPTLTNCAFINNSCGQGAAIHNLYSSLVLINCTFTANVASLLWEDGAISSWYGDLTLTNCILWGDVGYEIVDGIDSISTVTYSVIQGGFEGEGNIDMDPKFLDAPNGDLRVAYDSPCIDAGDNTAIPPLITVDLDGNPRFTDIPWIQDSGFGSAPIVDIGAYEAVLQQMFVIVGSPVTIPEGGTGSFTVALAMDPLGTVEVAVAVESGDTDITVVFGSTLTFDSYNYSYPQTVMLAAGGDGQDVLNGTAQISVSAAGFTTVLVVATEADNDAATILYVDANSPGVNNGTSWVDAFNTLQDALSFATEFPQVGEIRVAQGTYNPDVNSANPNGTGDREATFQLINGLAVKGGYAGFGEADPNARDIELYETVFSGDLNDDDGAYFDNYEENSYHVVTGSGTDFTAVLDGLIITGGYPEDADVQKGGGMYNDSGSPTVSNCTFNNNYGWFSGGGMYNYNSSCPIIINCTFNGNEAEGGGGICNNWSSHPTVTNCTFTGNEALNGGGMTNAGQSHPTLINCTFSGNSASDGGGMMNIESSPTLINCSFSGSEDISNFWHGNSILINCAFNDGKIIAEEHCEV